MIQGRLGRLLDERPVGQGVGEGQADLDHVRAVVRQGDQEVEAGRLIGKTGGHERDEGPASLLGGGLKGLSDAHGRTPRARET